MTDQMTIITVIGLAIVFAGLWIFTGRQKRRYEQERRERQKELERIKAEARAKTQK